MGADRLDRVAELDTPLVDVGTAGALDRVEDVGHRHCAEQPTGRTGLRRDPDVQRLETARRLTVDLEVAPLHAAREIECKDDFAPGRANEARLNRGDRPGSHWVPAECDVSIRPGWFYHSKEDSQVKSAATLLDLYYSSVGRGGSFLLNLAPDHRGQIPEPDVKSLVDFRLAFDATFEVDHAQGARVIASNTRDNKFSPRNVIDGRRDTYWTTDDRITTPELTLNLSREQTFNVVRVRESLPLGQRVEAFAVDIWKNNDWQEFARGTSIGNCKLLRGKRVTTTKVRLRITQSPVCPAISEFALFAEPADK